ncbi:MAG: general secretion pathway protein GspB [Acidiferrobacterales bacterium]
MSYILDALKKSEQERGVREMLAPTNSAGTLAAPLNRRWWPIILALLLVIVALLVLLRFWAHDGVPAKPVAAQASAETIESRTAVTGGVELSELGHVDRADVRDLAEQAGVRSGKKPKSPKATAEVATMAVAVAEPSMDDFTQEEVSEVDPADIPFLRQMPEAFREGVPEMVVNVHLYSANEAENLVYINDRQVRKGDRIEAGVRLKAIVHDGVVLDHGGTKFKLPRPN